MTAAHTPNIHPRDAFAVFATVVVIVCLVALAVFVDRRTEALRTIEQSSQRIEEAVVALDSPAAFEAAETLADIKSMLCGLAEFAEAEECPGS